jgi:orotidine-5'-phosphate decarboxylase
MAAGNPVCVALDTPDLARAEALAKVLKGRVGFLKLGLEFFYANGAHGYEAVARHGIPIFLDLKLHDIPNTVASAFKPLMALAPAPVIVNVHASGGAAMMEAARDAVNGRSKLIAVTVLTSLSTGDIHAAGFDAGRDAGSHAVSLAQLAMDCGLDGVVCSPREVSAIKSSTRADFLAVVPGIRPADSSTQDQKRVATPQAALAAGADILVIGRPITGADDPAKAADEILRG